MTRRKLTFAGTTRKGNYRLLATSSSRPELTNEVMVSGDGSLIRCDCAHCAYHPDGDTRTAKLTVKRRDVLSGKVKVCWHIWNAAKVAPLLVTRKVPA